jgi:hypothetical protein
VLLLFLSKPKKGAQTRLASLLLGIDDFNLTLFGSDILLATVEEKIIGFRTLRKPSQQSGYLKYPS